MDAKLSAQAGSQILSAFVFLNGFSSACERFRPISYSWKTMPLTK